MLSILITIWMPLIGSFVFERWMKKKRDKEFDSGSLNTSLSGDDEFRYVMFEDSVLLHDFEK